MIIKKYTQFPSIRKLTESTDAIEFLALGFEVYFENHIANTTTAASFYMYFVLDYYEKKTSISFEMCPLEITGDHYLHEIKEKKLTKNIKFTTCGNDDIKLKAVTPNTSIEGKKNVSEVLQTFIEADIKPAILSIKDYLDKHNIHYENEKLNKYFKNTMKASTEFFQEDNLIKTINTEIRQENNMLLFHYMNENMAEKTVVKRPKI